jgi:hydrogenase nickel incorporation protein HypA/HybF
MGITSEVLTAVLDAAAKAGAVRVNTVRLTVGELTEIVPDALQFAWEALTPGTLAEGAALDIDHVAARSRCAGCATEFEHDRFERICPSCGSFLVEVLAGNELNIGTVDVELAGDAVVPSGVEPREVEG